MSESNSISLNEALKKSNYTEYTKSKVKSFILEIEKQYKSNSFLYLTKCFNKNIIVIKFDLTVLYKAVDYIITLLIYIPVEFPNELRIYFECNQDFKIDKYYQELKIIDDITAELYYNKIIQFIPLQTPFTTLIKTFTDKFNKNFPLFKSNDNPEFFGPCRLDEKNSFKIEINEEDLKESKELNDMRQKIKDKILLIMDKKLLEIQENKSRLEELKIRINTKLDNYQTKKTNYELEEMNVKMVELISKLEVDIQNLKYKEYKTILDKSEEIVHIKDEKIYKYKVIEKTLDSFIFYLKKSFEKNLISCNKCTEEIRKVSKELFFVKYCIEKGKFDK